MGTRKIDWSEFTKLPVEELVRGDSAFSWLIITTPMGKKEIHLTSKNYPLFFGSVTQTNKSLSELIKEISKIEEQSKDYLVSKWLEDLIK